LVIERSLQLYNIPAGRRVLQHQPKGHLTVHPFGQPGPVIGSDGRGGDIRERKLGFPCVVRFQDLLRSRVKQLNEVFRAASPSTGTRQVLRRLPHKVNQMREVVEEILDGRAVSLRLEAGSKGELLIVLALNTDPEALTICTATRTRSTSGWR